MFSATDKMANVLKPLQLLEMKLGPCEIKYHEQKLNMVTQLDFFVFVRLLFQKSLIL